MERTTTILWCGVVLALSAALFNYSQGTAKRAQSHTLIVKRDEGAQPNHDLFPGWTTSHAESVPKKFSVTVRRPLGPPTIELTTADPQGRQGAIACSTCHSVREPNFENRTPADLDEFHLKMPMSHGTLACYSCHNPDDTDTLRLADSTAVEYPDVMTLCAQCHGTQARNYQHGAHGGMSGYWDLSRGPRSRNNCIDCHDPHVPKFPSMRPTFKPRDRFLEPTESHASPPHQQHSSSEPSRE
jgi:formate-dependent nitrite reductase cytochrome c552 subunit